jgi:hypothetical protein
MKVQELVGAKVWVKDRFLPRHKGRIASILKAIDLDDIGSSVTASIFRIELTSGDIIETSGFNIVQIDHAGYIQESAKHGYRIAF